MVVNPLPFTTYVVIMVYGRVGEREVHEDAWIYLDRPIKLYDEAPDSPWLKAVAFAMKLTAEKLGLTSTTGLHTAPKDWSEDVDVLNEGLLPIPDGL